MGLLTATLFALTAPGATLPPPQVDGQVRLTLNQDAFGPGDPVRAQVEVTDDGYLIVFRVDGDGRVRVVFPMDPDLDAFVRGGRRYELRGRNASATFSADDLGGAGIVFAALSRDPLRFTQFAVGDHWDYEMLHLGELSGDPEAALHRLVRAMSGNGRYDYDVTGYRVYAPAAVVADAYPLVVGIRDPLSCFSCGGWVGAGWGHSTIGVRIAVDPWDSWYGSWYDYRPHIAVYSHPTWYDYYWYNAAWGDPYWRYGGAPWARVHYPGQYAPYTTVNNWYRPRPDPNPRFDERARPRASIAPPIGFVSGIDPNARPMREPLTGTSRPATPPPDQTRARATPVSTPPTGSAPPPVVQQPPTRPTTAGSGQQQGRGQQSTGQGGSQQGGSAPPPPTRARPPVGGGQQSQQSQGQGGQGGGSRGAVTTPPPASAGARPVFRDPPPVPVTGARDAEKKPPVTSPPVYREPVRPTTPPPQTRTPPTGSSREPVRATTPPPTRSAPPPQTGGSREPVRATTPPPTRSAPPQTGSSREPVRATTPPPTRSAPPPPPPSTSRSTPPPPPPPPPPTSGGGQSRARPPGGGGF